MKKSFILLSAMAVAAFASCVKEQSVEVKEEAKGVPFEFTASTVDTKTTNDGMVTSWKANDKINLFHAEATTSDYSDNDEFTITSENLAAKKFTGNLASALDPSKSYDWYALYPYNVAFTTPANTTGYVSIGGSSRTQTGYGSTAHLNELPLVGKAANVAAAEKPAITMNHMAAVLKIVVTNTTSEELTVTNVSFTAPVKITGQFIVDFSDPANPAYSDGTYCYNYCNMKVNSGTALGNGESATFYIPIKPVTLAMGSEISLKVNTYTKVVNMPSEFTFTPGKMTTINFDYDKTFTSKNFYQASSISAGDKIMFVSGTSGEVKVMAHYGGANNYPATAGSITAGRLPSTSSMGVFTVAGNSTDGYTFYDPETERYITATNTTDNNFLKGISPADSYSSWAVSFDGAATITCKGKASRNVIKYNSNSNLYAAYNSDYTTNVGPVYIFKQDDRTPVTLTFTNTEINKTTSNYGEFTGQTATASPAVSGITYALSGAAIGTVETATGIVTLNGSEGSATITATYPGDATYTPASASYTITVVGTSLKPTFSFTDCPTGWPSGTKNAEINGLSGGSYDYVVSERTYSFTLSDCVGYHTGHYLAIMKNKYVGLPKLSGYKLTKVVVGNSSGCSTTTTLKITSDTAGDTVVTGGTAQTFATQGSTYTYNLSGTSNNTMYYMIVSGNTQVISLSLTFEKVE